MLLFCTISPEGDCMDGQACGKFCLHRHAGIRRATDSEQLCCELSGYRGDRIGEVSSPIRSETAAQLWPRLHIIKKRVPQRGRICGRELMSAITRERFPGIR